MKRKEIVRVVDSFGRFVVPKKVREQLGIKSGTKLELVLMKDEFRVRIYVERCEYCDKPSNNVVMGHHICDACIKKISEQAKSK